jgi:DNA-binding HxlR family transcriptional regulator
VLIQQLRELQEHGVVARRVSTDLPLRVDYSATPLGTSLTPILASLWEWGQQHAVAVGESDRLERCPDA